MQTHRSCSGPVKGSSSRNFLRKGLKVESTGWCSYWLWRNLHAEGEQKTLGQGQPWDYSSTFLGILKQWKYSSWPFPCAKAASLHLLPCLAPYPVPLWWVGSGWMPSTPPSHSIIPLHNWMARENIRKGSQVKDRKRSLTKYHHRQSRLSLGIIN